MTNTGAGHHYPTGSPLRQVLLVVRATDGDGSSLCPCSPATCCPTGQATSAGEAGQAFAKILRDTLTGEEPTYSPTGDWSSSSRIRASPLLPRRSSAYRFEAAGGASDAQGGTKATVEVQLLFRRTFQQLQAWKGWDDADILLASGIYSKSR